MSGADQLDDRWCTAVRGILTDTEEVTSRTRNRPLWARYHTGWLEADPDGTATYAPHTAAGFVGPPNKTLLLLGNGLVAKLGVRSARKAGRLTELPAGMSPMLDRPPPRRPGPA